MKVGRSLESDDYRSFHCIRNLSISTFSSFHRLLSNNSIYLLGRLREFYAPIAGFGRKFHRAIASVTLCWRRFGGFFRKLAMGDRLLSRHETHKRTPCYKQHHSWGLSGDRAYCQISGGSPLAPPWEGGNRSGFPSPP